MAEGGTYRRIGDPAPDNVMLQNGVHVDALTYAWGDEFPGFHGTIGGLLRDLGAAFPGKRFDYVDLSYDPVRDPSGEFRWMDVPRSPNGVGAFGEKKVYVPANTIVNCDFLITVPVMKVHMGCGITACLKNYVGTAPRMVYAPAGSFSNGDLHRKHSLEGRVDSFITDLAAFHPPDYCVVDAIRGLQNSEHGIDIPGQMVRSNLILAGEDPVAVDALVATLTGYLPSDIEYLHMASQRQMGSMRLEQADVAGDDPARFRRRWVKPRNWYGRCNREWLLTQDALGRYQVLDALYRACGYAAPGPLAAPVFRSGRLQGRRARHRRREPQSVPVGRCARAIEGLLEWRQCNGGTSGHPLPHRTVPAAGGVAFRRKPARIRIEASVAAG